MAILAAVIWLVADARAPKPPSGDAAPVAALPDFATLPPKERFLRLADQVQGAIQSGDSATVVERFPMVETAFVALGKDERDIDARFHLSLLRAEVGHFPGAVAELDSIAATEATHLFADYLRALIADFQGDTTAAREARRAFRSHYDAEVASARPEYLAHRSLLEDFLKTTPTN